MVRINKIKVFCASVLLFIAIIVYITIHGTENLVITKVIQSLCPFIDTIKPTHVHNRFIKNYFVDILWFSSFLIFVSINQKLLLDFLALLTAVLLEVLQFYLHNFGTFDYLDIFIYLIIFFISIILRIIGKSYCKK